MDIRDIEYFAAVAEHGNLGRAAEALGLSTPALSKCLRRLEKAMQTKLVTRTPKGVELTTEGNVLLAHVRPLRLSLHDITREIADLNQGHAGHLRLGTSTGSADCLLPAAFGALLGDAPNVTVSITVGVNPVLIPALRNGQLDLLVITLGNLPYEGIVQEYLYEDEFVIYASAGHRLAKRRPVEVADLANEGWALPVPDGVPGNWLRRVFEDHGLPPPSIKLVGGQMQIRLEAIGASSLLGIAPKRSVREAATRLRLTEIPVKGLAWSRQVGVGYRKDAYLSPVARRFIEILKKTAKEVAPGKQ